MNLIWFLCNEKNHSIIYSTATYEVSTFKNKNKRILSWDVFNIINLSRHEQVCLSGLRFERHFSHNLRLWEKYLSKRNPLKHTCSWSGKFSMLWILNREAKIFLRMRHFCFDFLFYICLSVRSGRKRRPVFYSKSCS